MHDSQGNGNDEAPVSRGKVTPTVKVTPDSIRGPENGRLDSGSSPE